VVPHPKPWRLSEYAGAAPMAAIAIMQPADATRILSERKRPLLRSGQASTTVMTPAERQSFPAKPPEPHFHGRVASAAASGRDDRVRESDSAAQRAKSDNRATRGLTSGRSRLPVYAK
jgi:hypothetical protein